MIKAISIIKDIKKISSTNVPKTVFWAIINHCNAVCTTCNFYHTPKSIWKYVKFEEAKKAIDILYDNDFRMISITGGEPLMNPDFFSICNYIKEKNMITTYVPTNGILITPDIARKLKDAEVRLMGISIDINDGKGMGLTRKIPNLFDIVKNARECLENKNIKTYAGILITKSTLDISKILELVRDLGFKRIIFSYPQLYQLSSYMAHNEMKDLILNVNEVSKLVEEIKYAKKKSDLSIHNPSISLDELVRFYKEIPRNFKCYGGSKLFYLDWNLNLYKCFTLPHTYGNILKIKKIDFQDDPCDLCTQQAFRDHDPFYYLASTITESKALLFQGRIDLVVKLLAKKNTRQSISALCEPAKGDFI